MNDSCNDSLQLAPYVFSQEKILYPVNFSSHPIETKSGKILPDSLQTVPIIGFLFETNIQALDKYTWSGILA
ncbi:hypothetical protein SAMN05444266_102249 [Chitinophaga jiangningensis]|uniref:Uncharacterized protein n=1 Tax=Chitinophaga jiangningensis TaxID=1419482 RepID=A0A1M6YCJ6_9BACT|nr:hypothetical protein SAMN05444266_102249 [Chitinophaga jiangningensis]